jgi:hypothetical protein
LGTLKRHDDPLSNYGASAMPTISPKDIHFAGERAAHFRRRQAIVNGVPSEHALMERISFVAGMMRPTKDSDWWIIGTVVDLVADGELLVYFNPTTKAVKVQRPPQPEVITPTRQTSAFPHALTNRGVGASQAYRYFYEGKEYSPDEAAKIVKQRGTIGWRWEPK